jgi:2-methylaconitate cis-trans-isomerase PrpF
MDVMNLIRAQAMVATAGTTNATTVQVRNLTKHASNDALSGAISIASAGTIGTAGTVNTSYDGVSTNDKMRVKVESVSTTAPKGLYVICEFRLP